MTPAHGLIHPSSRWPLVVLGLLAEGVARTARMLAFPTAFASAAVARGEARLGRLDAGR